MNTKSILAGLLLFSASATAYSPYTAGNQTYIGYARGYYQLDATQHSHSTIHAISEKDWGNKYFAGVRLGDNFAVEGFHYDFGTLHDARHQAARTKTSGVTSIMHIPLGNNLSVFGKLGVHQWDMRISSRRTIEKSEGADVLFGAGVAMQLGAFGLRLEHEKFEFDKNDIGVTSLGAAIYF
ncbi:outer membrane beta-barrel protein [Thaumasiovibrio sp. DFM-14]|uniref:outer membrane beta-barrel protein n=1 Tax=Thaumasiovibrio sp. DFM-14 TaxID=3384792 RepID=UPI0039A2BFEA